MSKDLFITNTNKNNYINFKDNNEILDDEISVQVNAYADFMKMERVATNHHRTNIRGNEITDSVLMDTFKQKLIALTEFYKKEIPTDLDMIQKGIRNLDQKYEYLITSANKYIDSRSNFWKKIWRFSQGYERLELVKTINAKAQKDRACLKRRAKYIVDNSKNSDENNGRPLWANVLAELQSETLNVGTFGDVNFALGHRTGFGLISKGEQTVATVEEYRLKTKPCEYDPLKQYLIEDEGYVDAIRKYASKNKKMNSESYKELYNLYRAFLNKVMYHRIAKKLEKGESTQFEKSDVIKRFYAWVRGLENSAYYIELFNEMNNAYKKDAGESDIGESDIIKDSFLHYYQSYHDNMIMYQSAPIPDNHNISVRNVLKYRMAELLGIEDMVQESKLVNYIDDENKNKTGVLIEVQTRRDIDQDGATILESKELRQQINTLELFDFITGQTFRNLSDFGLINNKIKLCNNEMSFGVQDYKSMLKLKGCKFGLLIANIPNSLANRILEISDEAINLMFIDFLDKEEIKALISRIHGVQKWIKDNPVVIDENQQIIVDEELDPLEMRPGTYLYALTSKVQV